MRRVGSRFVWTAASWLAVWWNSLASVGVADSPADPPTDAAQRVAAEIRHEVLLPPRGPEGRPLPLASHWNMGLVSGTFAPEHQIALIQQGHHVLPWLAWPDGDPRGERFEAYYGRLLRYFAALHLPISFRGTQWNAMLVGKAYREGPESCWAGVIAPDGRRVARVSPFGPTAPWKDPAARYVDTPAMKRAQELYPDPPRVLWVSNNEPPELRWAKHSPLEEQSKRYVDRYGRGRTDEFKRKVVGQGWIERYRVMFDAMRGALTNDRWRRSVRFVGYDAFGPAHFGRWGGWKVYSLVCDKWTAPDWYYWDGGSPSYYTHNWNDNRDHWVFSTQVQSMNWVFMLDEAWSVNPDFWFEISVWDGNEARAWMEGLGVERPERLAEASSRVLTMERRRQLSPRLLKKSKALQVMAEGQTYPPERTAGWVQFGMWLLRPRVVREFRSHTTPLRAVLPYWMEVVKAVDRVYAQPVLREFWRQGRLVRNDAHRHPYQTDIPEKYRDIRRWYLLDTSLDPPRPWGLHTHLPVFSLALALGDPGARRWLLYAHSPLEDRHGVRIAIPGFGEVCVDTPRVGAFYVIEEGNGRARRID